MYMLEDADEEEVRKALGIVAHDDDGSLNFEEARDKEFESFDRMMRQTPGGRR